MQYTDIVAATSAGLYLVLDYKSANMPWKVWNYGKLRNAAESWVAYIVRQGHQARLTLVDRLTPPFVHHMQPIPAQH